MFISKEIPLLLIKTYSSRFLECSLFKFSCEHNSCSCICCIDEIIGVVADMYWLVMKRNNHRDAMEPS